MYEYLTGKLIMKSATKMVLDVQGIGYEIRIPVSTFSKLPPLGETVKVWIHFVVREDAQFLYGFYTEEEREVFRLLISVSGIGPKLAATILSGTTISELKQAIIQGMLPALTSIPGIGKKIAERVIIELREKVALEGIGAGTELPGQGDSLLQDSLQALIELGYKRQNAQSAVQKAIKELEGPARKSVSEIIRKSLKYV